MSPISAQTFGLVWAQIMELNLRQQLPVHTLRPPALYAAKEKETSGAWRYQSSQPASELPGIAAAAAAAEIANWAQDVVLQSAEKVQVSSLYPFVLSYMRRTMAQ
jgi:hypothetical protein